MGHKTRENPTAEFKARYHHHLKGLTDAASPAAARLQKIRSGPLKKFTGRSGWVLRDLERKTAACGAAKETVTRELAPEHWPLSQERQAPTSSAACTPLRSSKSAMARRKSATLSELRSGYWLASEGPVHPVSACGGRTTLRCPHTDSVACSGDAEQWR